MEKPSISTARVLLSDWEFLRATLKQSLHLLLLLNRDSQKLSSRQDETLRLVILRLEWSIRHCDSLAQACNCRPLEEAETLLQEYLLAAEKPPSFSEAQ